MSEVITVLEASKQAESYLQDHLHEYGYTVRCREESVGEISLEEIEDTTVLVPFINSHISDEVMDALPHLQLITTRSTGYDHIDIEAAKKRDISVTNVPTYGENTVAEHTFALILALSRQLYPSFQRTDGLNFSPQGLEGFDLKGKTIGVIGTGNIGSHVIRMAYGFNMDINAFDVNPDETLQQTYGVEYMAFEDVLQTSDIITLHVPHNEHTHHLINQDNIHQIKSGAYIINTARGGLIETGALITGLREGYIAGAGLDVLEEECNITDEAEVLTDAYLQRCNIETVLQGHVLIKDSRVLVTPHNAFNSKEAKHRIWQTTVDNITNHIENFETPNNIIPNWSYTDR
ncbi:MAG: NAD(P)-dependent oxidoreductase [Candidatus Paceibacteria bacterium]